MNCISGKPKKNSVPCLDEYLSEHAVEKELFATEMQNLPLYGYGIKGFILSMIETSLRICGSSANPAMIEKIIGYGKDLLGKPIELLDDVEQVLKSLIILTTAWLLQQKATYWTRNGNSGIQGSITIFIM